MAFEGCLFCGDRAGCNGLGADNSGGPGGGDLARGDLDGNLIG